MLGSKMSSSAPPQPPPIITVYRNGDPHFIGKKLVVNRRYYRSFENFLDRITTDTRSRYAIRKIHTPAGGTRVGGFENIKNGAIYVAAGTERFRRIQYGTDTRISSIPSTNTLPAIHNKIIATSRYKQEAMAEPLKNRIIFVYRNGEEKTPPMKLLLDKRTISSMDSVLQYISNKINLTSGAVKTLYSLDTSTRVVDCNEIHTNMSYVAVGSGKYFVKCKYSNDSFDKSISPRHKASNKFNKSKEMKKIGNEPKRVITHTSLSLPEDDTLKSGLIALAVESTDKVLNDSNTSHDTSVDIDLDVEEKNLSSVEDNANELDESISKTVGTPVTKSPVNDTKSIDGQPETTKSHNSPPLNENNGEISQETLNDMSGTPPVPMLSEDEKSNNNNNNVDKNDETINSIENPPFTNSPVINKVDKDIVDSSVSNELPGPLEVSSSENDNISSTESESAESVEESVNVQNDELSNTHKNNVTEEEQAVYKASGVQKESGEQVKDDKETVVEKLIDMVPAAEVEEDLEAEDQPSNFYTH